MDPALLARTLTRLKEVKMCFTLLTVEQSEAVLTQSLVNTSLRKLEMYEDREDFLDENCEDLLNDDLVAKARLVIGELVV